MPDGFFHADADAARRKVALVIGAGRGIGKAIALAPSLVSAHHQAWLFGIYVVLFPLKP
jgi:hypothetical protein